MSEQPTERQESTESQVTELSGFKRSLLVLLLIAIISGIGWVIYQQTVLIPSQEQEQAQQAELEKIRAKQNAIEEAARLEKQQQAKQAEQEKLKAKEEERLKQILIHSKATETAIQEMQWDTAEQHITKLENNQFDKGKITQLRTRIRKEKEAEKKRLVEVNLILTQAKDLDQGVYSEEAIQLLDKALAIYPKHEETMKLRNKIDAYTSEYKIPEDAATFEDLLPKLRAGDTVHLAPGKYSISEILEIPLHIKGAGREKTIIECDTTQASAFVFQPQSSKKSASLSGVTVRGTTYQDFNIDRHPLILIKSPVLIDDSLIQMSSGHGIAVLSGKLTIKNSEVSYNAWDAISVRGAGAEADITKCAIHTNYDHGVDFWENSTGSILDCEIYENSGSGIVVMGDKAKVNITQVRSYRNEQCGIAVMDAATVELARVVSASNVLSGIAVHGKNSKITFGIVISNNNKEAGYYLDPASSIVGYKNTTSEGNLKGALVEKALEFELQRQSE